MSFVGMMWALGTICKLVKTKRSQDYAITKKLLKRWQPYAGPVYLHLLSKSIDDRKITAATT